MTSSSRRLLATVAGVLAVAVAVALADAERTVVDLTQGESLTLSTQTVDVLAALDRDVEITLFARRSDPGRVEAISLLDRYRRADRRIDVEVLDPDDAPGEVERLGVDPLLGGVAVRAGDRVETVPFATEGDLTGALARLVRDVETVICATVGHGERRVADDSSAGLATFHALLERDGHQIVEIDLLADPSVPDPCAVVVVAAPTGTFTNPAEAALARWVDDDGRLLLLSDPLSGSTPLAATLEALGLRIEAGVVLEGDGGNVVGGDVSAPIVTRYASANPVVRRLPPTFFPLVQEVAVLDVDEDASPGLTTTALAQTSEVSYLERNPVSPEFDPDHDRAGPVTVVAAADRSRVDGDDVRRTRAVVVGDVDFASNAAVGEAGNAQLVRQAVAWLTETEDLVAVSPNLPRDRPLRLTEARADYARVLSIGVVPGMFLLAGAMVWALRRGR